MVTVAMIGIITVLIGMSAPTGWLESGMAAEKGKKVEIEDVSVAEKIKWAKATKVPLVDALKTALAHTPGQAIEAELESIDGRLVYEVEIVTSDGKVVEIYIDPQTGKLIEAGGKQ
jgi:uncharacterized membrane protein YkoI